MLPPPNVTGVLTLGHMLGDTVMDVLARYHRMRGEPTLWVPGVDHAGLATQVEVRRRLQRQGTVFEDLPREVALAEIERWRSEHERRIVEQIRAGGFSVDWTRFRYTMDAASVRATREAFVSLFREGLVYRGERMVNWDPRLRTAVSDLEVVHSEEEGDLLFVRYPWADGAPEGILVATVRPEIPRCSAKTESASASEKLFNSSASQAATQGQSLRREVKRTEQGGPGISLATSSFQNVIEHQKRASRLQPIGGRLDLAPGIEHANLELQVAGEFDSNFTPRRPLAAGLKSHGIEGPLSLPRQTSAPGWICRSPARRGAGISPASPPAPCAAAEQRRRLQLNGCS